MRPRPSSNKLDRRVFAPSSLETKSSRNADSNACAQVSVAWESASAPTRMTVTFLILVTMPRVDTKHDRVMVFFDERGVVEHVGSGLNGENAEYGMPF